MRVALYNQSIDHICYIVAVKDFILSDVRSLKQNGNSINQTCLISAKKKKFFFSEILQRITVNAVPKSTSFQIMNILSSWDLSSESVQKC